MKNYILEKNDILTKRNKGNIHGYGRRCGRKFDDGRIFMDMR